jgi:hypothetical protein
LAYVTCTMPRGSIGAPPERGAEAYTVRSEHVSAPDPRLALIKAWVFSVPESRDPAVSGLDPTQRGPEPILGVQFAPVEVLDLTRRSGLYIQGYGTFPCGSGLTVDTLEYIIFSGHVAPPEPSTWWGRVLLLVQSSRLRLGQAVVWPHAQLLYHATRDSHVGTVSSYYSKGYPSFRVPTVALGPTSGEDTSLQVGPKLYWRLARRFHAFADVITANPPSVMPTAMSVSAAD